jgi:hypothetical protein
VRLEDAPLGLALVLGFAPPAREGMRCPGFTIPRRAWVTSIAVLDSRQEVGADIEPIEKVLRESRLVRKPLGSGRDQDEFDQPTGRYAIRDPAVAVAAARVSRAGQGQRLVVELEDRLRPGPRTALVAVSPGGDLAKLEIATTQFRVEAAP